MLFRKFSYERAIAVAIVLALVLLPFVYQKLELSKQMTGLDRTPSEFCKVMRDAFAFGDLDQQLIDLLPETTPHYPTKEEVIQKLYFGQSPYDGFETLELPPEIYQPAAETVEAAKRPIVDRVLDLIGREPRIVLEVGSFLGTSIVHGWANLIGKGKDGILLSIDTWEGAGFLRLSPEYRPHMNLQHGMPQTYKYFMTNVVKHGLSETIFPLTLPSLVGARFLGYLNWKVDVVYLDSAHEAGETYIELQLYFDLLEPGGILFGDDYDSYPAVRHDVNRFASCNGLEVVTFPNTFLLQKPL